MPAGHSGGHWQSISFRHGNDASAVDRRQARLRVRGGRDVAGGGRRGRCFAETDLMTIRLAAVRSRGVGLRSGARAISAFTAGRSKVASVSTTMWRARLPLPWSRCSGSGRSTALTRNTLTQRGKTAMENMASDARSVGPESDGERVVVVVDELDGARKACPHFLQHRPHQRLDLGGVLPEESIQLPIRRATAHDTPALYGVNVNGSWSRGVTKFLVPGCASPANQV
jgi:hypothetical protein